MANQLTCLWLLLVYTTSSVFGLHVVCYFSNWAQHRRGTATFVPEDIDPKLCTHIIYAFAAIVGNKLSPTEWNDATPGGMYARINNLKKINPNVKTLLAVGGWGQGVSAFSQMVASPATRSSFIADSVTYLRRFNFDGLDLDWEYPGARGSPAIDKKRFTQLVMELRKEFRSESQRTRKKELLLTAAVPASQYTVEQGYEVREVARNLDFINLMSYDLHGSWESSTGHHSPLYARSSEFGAFRNLNTEWAANNWANKGTPRSKIIVGMGMYGKSFRLASASNNGIGAPAIGAGSPGPLTQQSGFLAYYEICSFVKNGWTRYWHDEHKVPYAVRGTEWVGYDDVQSITIKYMLSGATQNWSTDVTKNRPTDVTKNMLSGVTKNRLTEVSKKRLNEVTKNRLTMAPYKSNWIKRNGFGGGMIWAVDQDDFGNQCGAGSYPLLSTINRVLGSYTPPRPVTTAPTTVRTTTSLKPTTRKCHWWCKQTTVARTTRPTTRASTRRSITTKKTPTNVAFRCPRSVNGQYPDANDCSVFHICVNGRDFQLSCGGSLKYNPKLKVCDYAYKVNC